MIKYFVCIKFIFNIAWINKILMLVQQRVDWFADKKKNIDYYCFNVIM